MDVLPNGGIFKELQLVHDTGYFSSACSLEEHWQQVSVLTSSSSPPSSSASRLEDHSARGQRARKEPQNSWPSPPPPLSVSPLWLALQQGPVLPVATLVPAPATAHSRIDRKILLYLLLLVVSGKGRQTDECGE